MNEYAMSIAAAMSAMMSAYPTAMASMNIPSRWHMGDESDFMIAYRTIVVPMIQYAIVFHPPAASMVPRPMRRLCVE
jgi:hypothetical protein